MASKRWLIFCIALLFTFVSETRASLLTAIPDPTTIISQSEVAYNGIVASDIQNYLQSAGSQLATYTIPHDFDVYYPIGKGQWDKVSVTQEWQPPAQFNAPLEIYDGKTIAQLIYEWSTKDYPDRPYNPSPGQINPIIVLATMDKESASVNGAYRVDIVSSHPITLSWLMGYGFNGRMADCVQNGNCDVSYNRQQSIFYGGPGQQLAEAISSLKSWSTNPNSRYSCNNNQWQYVQTTDSNGNLICLQVGNSIAYALYRYTPNYSGNLLFLNMYNQIKANFNIPPPVSVYDDYNNDVSDYSLETYSDKVTLFGKKAPGSWAKLGSTELAAYGSLTWQANISLNLGANNLTVDYTRKDGSIINQKKLNIRRHELGDINGDGKIDILDLSLLASYWGITSPNNSLLLLNQTQDHSTVDITDLSILAAHWTP